MAVRALLHFHICPILGFPSFPCATVGLALELVFCLRTALAPVLQGCLNRVCTRARRSWHLASLSYGPSLFSSVFPTSSLQLDNRPSHMRIARLRRSDAPVCILRPGDANDKLRV